MVKRSHSNCHFSAFFQMQHTPIQAYDLTFRERTCQKAKLQIHFIVVTKEGQMQPFRVQVGPPSSPRAKHCHLWSELDKQSVYKKMQVAQVVYQHAWRTIVKYATGWAQFERDKQKTEQGPFNRGPRNISKRDFYATVAHSRRG